jgi:16S rRNA (adenine(1408)-N(1))-methyltransferase
LANVLFLQAPVEDLPTELNGVADEIHVHFPWGSLLRGLAIGDATVLNNLRRVCAPEGLLEVIIGLDVERDKSEMQRLGIPMFDVEHIDKVLNGCYRQSGFALIERGQRSLLDWPELHSSWARRLRGNPARQLCYLIAKAEG